MLLTQITYQTKCPCGKQFYIIFQNWGPQETTQLNQKFKCLKCTKNKRKVKRTKISNINLLEKALKQN